MHTLAMYTKLEYLSTIYFKILNFMNWPDFFSKGPIIFFVQIQLAGKSLKRVGSFNGKTGNGNIVPVLLVGFGMKNHTPPLLSGLNCNVKKKTD